MTDGDIDLNGNNVSLSTAGTMTGEANVNRVFGSSGEIIASSRDLSLTSTLYSDIAGLGISITTGAGNTPGITTFERGHAAQIGAGNTSIERYFDITPTTNTALDATLNIEYYDNELNGQSEANFVFWKSTDGGSTWTNEGGTVNTGSNFVEETGVNELSRWTISNESTNPLPIELINFVARFDLDHVRLEWSTASETNNDYFTVERAIDPTDFRDLANIDGAGDSYQLRRYLYIDWVPYAGISYYRLKQTDFDGTYSYSKMVSVNNNLNSMQLHAYPNPAYNGRMQLSVMGFSPNEKITIQLYDSMGKLIFQELRITDERGLHEQSIMVDAKSGIYVLKVISKDNTLSKKLIID
ncbi:MAG: T9SS type A sorting domain-containing protein [Bacteroidetes bacterium]|nr:T9SS type A sorting domain-containing protein [Bacteroidota bacterium]